MNAVIQECRLCRATGPHQSFAVREMMFGTREQFQYFSCAACDTLQIHSPLSGEELGRHYPADYYSYETSQQPKFLRWLTTKYDRSELRTGGGVFAAAIAALPTGVRLALGDAIRAIGQFGLGRDARILDVGCGSGALLDRLSRAGFTNVTGADPFLARDCTTPEGVSLVKSHLHEVAGSFDLIMFNHSLEHVSDPVATLKDARDKLSDSGICLVRLPTTSSEAWTTYGSDWFQIDAPRHIVIPSRQGMALAAEAVGLRVDHTSDDSSVAQFIGSEAYRRDIPLTELTSLQSLLKLFGARQIWGWDRRAARLNRQGRGDQTGFVLRVVSSQGSFQGSAAGAIPRHLGSEPKSWHPRGVWA